MSKLKTYSTVSKEVESDLNLGLEQKARVKLAEYLAKALSTSYLLYVKTQSFHWNVVGPMFYGLHKMTEEQYQDLAEAIDDIAERIRAIGFTAPGSVKQFIQLSDIKEETGAPDAKTMVKQLIEGNELCSRDLRGAVLEADALNDVMTADLLTQRIGQHEQNAWMLRSLLEG